VTGAAPGGSAAPLPTLTVGIQVSPAMGLIMVADKKGFFKANGLDVQIKEFTAGKFALQAFLGGSIDVAVSGEVPVALSTLQGNDFRVIAQVVERTVNEVRVVARKEPGMTTPQKYFAKKKRKLATSFGGGPEFYTYNFLKRFKIPAAELQLGADAVTFTAPDIYSELYVVNVQQQTIDRKAGDLKNFLKALTDAAAYMQTHAEESKDIVRAYTQLDRKVIDGIWQNFVFRPAINDLFVTYTTAEARWAVETGKFPKGTKIPDFKAVLYPALLESVSRNSVALTSNP
jgi:NitT/TauT family transport system substrate-binding protein